MRPVSRSAFIGVTLPALRQYVRACESISGFIVSGTSASVRPVMRIAMRSDEHTACPPSYVV